SANEIIGPKCVALVQARGRFVRPHRARFPVRGVIGMHGILSCLVSRLTLRVSGQEKLMRRGGGRRSEARRRGAVTRSFPPRSPQPRHALQASVLSPPSNLPPLPPF